MKVAIVLGNMLNDDGSFSEAMKERLALTIKLNAELNPDIIILSGGNANPRAGESEAHAMYDYLVRKGLSEDKLIKEDRSLTTVQNAKYAVPIALSFSPDTIILCSSKEHIARTFLNPVRIFKRKLKGSGVKLTVYS